ncbi:hypothetical protein GH714_034283 [Hevea brasiliensis]|uniref:Uncharacterized protein n=1 Tax=Hevea brasiliensis TaxID=3981 RepID=A0A6A6MIZ3_HEVBR|nr:hypothetical protein GH714_034283 [Hevea brasiliensis]
MAGLMKEEEIVDIFEGIEITWYFDCRKEEDGGNEYFELRFEGKYREKVFNEYLDHVIRTYKAMTKENKFLRIYSRKSYCGWSWIDFQHAATFDTLAMDNELKKVIMDDLDRFLARKTTTRKLAGLETWLFIVWPPWNWEIKPNCCHANYLNYNVYDLELANISSDSDLRSAMLHVDRKSIIVIEDIDCNSGVHGRSKSDNSESHSKNVRFTLLSLLNCFDGLWSSCAEERIIVFTTNHKEDLDPALLRPGWMDVRIHMSYCTIEGFRVLVSNYLGLKDHILFEEIDGLIRCVEVTPASLAEKLMKNDADVALGEVLNFLKQKRLEKDKNEEAEEEYC